MEIFQTIWTALTTENEVLMKFVSMPFIFIEIALAFFLSITLLNLNISRKRTYIYILIASIISCITHFLTVDTLTIIVNISFIPILAIIILNVNIFEGILFEFLPMIIMLISETIWLNIANIFLNIQSDAFNIIPLYRIIMATLDYLLIYIVTLIARKYNFNITLLNNIPSKIKPLLLTNSIIGIITITTQIYLISFYTSSLPLFITIIGLISLLAYFFISIYSLANTSKLASTTIDLEQEKENNKILKEMQDELHGFRHDFSNIMCTIGGYVQVKDMDGLSNYYSQIQKDVVKINNLGALNSEVINNPAVFLLISSKYSKALGLGIEMNINVFIDLNKLNMKIYEFTRVLGILLDNAIEASKECDEKVINIEIRKESKRNRQILLIENTYTNKDVDTEKIFEKKYSTKEGNSGLGLWEVRKILTRNTNLNLFTSKDDRLFKQQLEMYNI